MNPASLSAVVWPHVAALVCCSARLLPVVFFCPLLGGRLVPSPVKLGLVLSLAVGVHFGGGVSLSRAPEASWPLLRTAGAELSLGMALGLLASLPFDAVRIAGRWIDTLRGASAEATLPGVGSHEAATGDLLHQGLVAAAAGGTALPQFLRALCHGFQLVPLGNWSATEAGALALAGLVGSAMRVAVALATPVVAVVIGVDLVMAIAVRSSPQSRLQEALAPLRLLAGAGVLWLGYGFLADSALGEVQALPERLWGWMELAP